MQQPAGHLPEARAPLGQCESRGVSKGSGTSAFRRDLRPEPKGLGTNSLGFTP
jgi:hypothetical protein